MPHKTHVSTNRGCQKLCGIQTQGTIENTIQNKLQETFVRIQDELRNLGHHQPDRFTHSVPKETYIQLEECDSKMTT